VFDGLEQMHHQMEERDASFMEGKIIYSRKNGGTEYIYYRDATCAYPVHTHASHHTFGIISGGAVCIVRNGEKKTYHTGEHFYIPPDTPHAIEPVNNTAYSMVTICVSVNDRLNREDREEHYIMRLKKRILEAPENAFLIKDMARIINVSPYHMIRQFKAVCGLTPHQFQIQCRVRKAQKLLEEGKSVTEAAYAAGFCDQSHFDRCFQRIVRLTPGEYKIYTENVAF